MDRLKQVLLSVILLACLLAPAAAQQRNEAAQVFARGKALFARHDYVGAIAAFERAYSLKPHYAVQCSIAHCYEQMNRYVESAEHYRRCLKEGAAKSPTAKKVRRDLDGVEARMNWIEVKSPGLGGTVYVNGDMQGAAPRRVPLNAGRHTIEVRREGARPASVKIKVLNGEERSVDLVPIATQPAVTARTEADPLPERTDAGRGPRGLSSAWFWTSAALTAALGIAAGTMGGLTYKAHSDYYDAPTKEGYDTFVSHRLVTNVLAGLAVAAGATGTVLFFYTDFGGRPKDEQEQQDEVAAGLMVRGQF